MYNDLQDLCELVVECIGEEGRDQLLADLRLRVGALVGEQYAVSDEEMVMLYVLSGLSYERWDRLAKGAEAIQAASGKGGPAWPKCSAMHRRVHRMREQVVPAAALQQLSTDPALPKEVREAQVLREARGIIGNNVTSAYDAYFAQPNARQLARPRWINLIASGDGFSIYDCFTDSHNHEQGVLKLDLDGALGGLWDSLQCIIPVLMARLPENREYVRMLWSAFQATGPETVTVVSQGETLELPVR